MLTPNILPGRPTSEAEPMATNIRINITRFTTLEPGLDSDQPCGRISQFALALIPYHQSRAANPYVRDECIVPRPFVT